MLDQAGTPVHVFPPEVGAAVLVVEVVVVVGATVLVGLAEVEEVVVEELGTEDPLQALTTDKVT